MTNIFYIFIYTYYRLADDNSPPSPNIEELLQKYSADDGDYEEEEEEGEGEEDGGA